MKKAQNYILFALSFAIVVIAAGCNSCQNPNTATAYVEFGNPAMGLPGTDDSAQVIVPRNDSSSSTVGKNAVDNKLATNTTADSAARTFRDARHSDNAAAVTAADAKNVLQNSAAGTPYCSGAGMCSASSSLATASIHAIPVTFTAYPNAPGTLNLTFSMAELKAKQGGNTYNSANAFATGAKYVFALDCPLPDSVFKSLGLPPTAKIAGGTVGTISVNAGNVTIIAAYVNQ